ncbi:MAG: hypothetical protein ACJA1B_001464 [Polaribacter sp.]|jgi:hypothetical protein
MKKTDYQIDGNKYTIAIKDSSLFQLGKDEVLLREDSDITFGQPWYKNGFSEHSMEE